MSGTRITKIDKQKWAGESPRGLPYLYMLFKKDSFLFFLSRRIFQCDVNIETVPFGYPNMLHDTKLIHRLLDYLVLVESLALEETDRHHRYLSRYMRIAGM